MRERLQAALYALSRGNVEEAREHVQAALDALPADSTWVAADEPPPDAPPSGD